MWALFPGILAALGLGGGVIWYLLDGGEPSGGGDDDNIIGRQDVDQLPYQGAAPDVISGADAATYSDPEALARMLASEDNRSYGARVVIGWIALTKARTKGISVYMLLTRGDGYGRQKRDGVKDPYYAASGGEPDKADRELAAALVNGQVQPSAAIRARGIGGWVERGQLGKQLDKALSRGDEDARLLEKQGDWNEGIWGRLKGTQWFLFSRSAPILARDRVIDVVKAKGNPNKAQRDEQLKAKRIALAEVATKTLDDVPEIPALDSGPAVA